MSLQGLTGSLSKELGDYNINVNTVCPGVIDTSRWDNKRDNTPTGREDWERLESNIPMGPTRNRNRRRQHHRLPLLR